MAWTDLSLLEMSVHFLFDSIALPSRGMTVNVTTPTALTRDTTLSASGTAWRFRGPLCHIFPSGFASGVQPSGDFMIIPPQWQGSEASVLDHLDYDQGVAYFTADPETEYGDPPTATYTYKPYRFGHGERPADLKVTPPIMWLRNDSSTKSSITIPTSIGSSVIRLIEKRRTFMVEMALRSVSERSAVLDALDFWTTRNQTTIGQQRYIDFNSGLALQSNGDRNLSFDPETQKAGVLSFDNVVTTPLSMIDGSRKEERFASLNFDVVGRYYT